GAPGYFREFYRRRVLRIFPLYYAAVLVRLWLLPWIFSAEPGLSYTPSQAAWALSYLNNVAAVLPGHQVASGLEHFWSLAVEEQFYIVWPALVLACSTRRLVQISTIMIVGSMMLRAFVSLVLGNQDVAYNLTPMRLDALGLGALLAIAHRAPGGLPILLPWRRMTTIAASTVVLAMAVANHGTLLPTPLMLSVGLPALEVLMAVGLVSALTGDSGDRIPWFFRLAWLRKLGTLSYGIYVIHLPVLLIARHV